MKILHVTHQYPPAIGGAETYIADVSAELARRGHQVDLFTHQSTDDSWENRLPPFEVMDGVNVHRFPSWRRNRLAWGSMHFGYRGYWQTRRRFYEPFIFFGSGPISPAMWRALYQKVQQVDIVHINQLHYSHAYPAYRIARHFKRPLLLSPLIHHEQPVTYDVGYLQTIIQGVDHVLTVTRAEKEFMQEMGWHEQITVGGVGLNLAEFPPLSTATCRQQLGLPDDAFVLLFLGRKAHYKGLELCLQSLHALRQQGRNAYLLAFGPETDHSQSLWAKYGQLEGVISKGHVSAEERLQALAACDVLTLPSTGESFGIVYLEAWAYHKPVIGIKVKAVASLIQDEHDGLLLSTASAALLTGALITLADDPARAQAIAEAGYRKVINRYTTERIGDIMEGAYQRTLRQVRM